MGKATSSVFSRYSNFELLVKLLFLLSTRSKFFIRIIEKALTPKFLDRRWVSKLIQNTVYRIFLVGETIPEVRDYTNARNAPNKKFMVDYCVEGAQTESDIRANFDTYSDLINQQWSDNVAVVIKPSSLSFDEELLSGEVSTQHMDLMDKLCALAASKGILLFIDAEQSWYQGTIHKIEMEMIRKYNRQSAIIFATYQMYLKDTLNILKRDLEESKKEGFHLGVKMVRGAYLESENDRALQNGYESPVCESKEHTDTSFNEGAQLALDDSISVCFATHNQYSCSLVSDHLLKSASQDYKVSFAHLHGMAEDLYSTLSQEDFVIYTYVPFGPIRQSIPYLLRRIQENSGVQNQGKQETRLILKELKQRLF
ncbi:proline dehydrogenase family protein [Reichenbachiella versicolor]|uniref:proline dehydrogenase family protein n=1 Tax=Reichenbachiella versicolor TaxID=1821036 RepID=UPI000D6E4EDC|nr:proline dehydrogenase family protein [Reichenbachiella versicolor]